ncbi:MAG: adenosylcobinamide-GDP ribazoletransferase [Coriobacteriales bacterium]
MKALRDVATAFSWMTVLPAHSYDDAHPVRYLPLVGWVFGLAGLGVAELASTVVSGDVAALFVGLVVVSEWAAGSRLLHWDGLGDTADGVWGGDTPERRLEIMHDSTMGSFGVVAICMTLMAQVLSVSAVFGSGDWWPIVAAPVIGRFSACVALWTIDPARPEGLAATLAGGEGMGPWAIAALTVAVVFFDGDPVHMWAGFVGIMCSVLLPHMLSRPVRGLTGDIIGASILIVETVVLIGAALMAGV